MADAARAAQAVLATRGSSLSVKASMQAVARGREAC